jgi:hypothetical protein
VATGAPPHRGVPGVSHPGPALRFGQAVAPVERARGRTARAALFVPATEVAPGGRPRAAAVVASSRGRVASGVVRTVRVGRASRGASVAHPGGQRPDLVRTTAVAQTLASPSVDIAGRGGCRLTAGPDVAGRVQRRMDQTAARPLAPLGRGQPQVIRALTAPRGQATWDILAPGRRAYRTRPAGLVRRTGGPHFGTFLQHERLGNVLATLGAQRVLA